MLVLAISTSTYWFTQCQTVFLCIFTLQSPWRDIVMVKMGGEITEKLVFRLQKCCFSSRKFAFLRKNISALSQTNAKFLTRMQKHWNLPWSPTFSPSPFPLRGSVVHECKSLFIMPTEFFLFLIHLAQIHLDIYNLKKSSCFILYLKNKALLFQTRGKAAEICSLACAVEMSLRWGISEARPTCLLRVCLCASAVGGATQSCLVGGLPVSAIGQQGLGFAPVSSGWMEI